MGDEVTDDTEFGVLRIHLGEDDRWGRQPLYEAVVRKAHELGLAGATVLHGVMGYGADSHIRTAKVLRLAEGLPVIVEVIDRRERLDLLLPHLREMVGQGVVTLERVEVLQGLGVGAAAPK